GRVTGRQRLAERLDRAFVGNVVAEQDRHQGRLAGAVFAEQGEHFAFAERERNGVVRDQRAETLGDAGKAQDRRRHRTAAEKNGPRTTAAGRFVITRPWSGGGRLGLAVVDLHRELAGENRGLALFHAFHQVGRHTLLERAERREFRTLGAHVAVLRVVLGAE